GSSVSRPMTPPPIWTSSTFPFSNVRTSSGVPSRLCSGLLMVPFLRTFSALARTRRRESAVRRLILLFVRRRIRPLRWEGVDTLRHPVVGVREGEEECEVAERKQRIEQGDRVEYGANREGPVRDHLGDRSELRGQHEADHGGDEDGPG